MVNKSQKKSPFKVFKSPSFGIDWLIADTQITAFAWQIHKAYTSLFDN